MSGTEKPLGADGASPAPGPGLLAAAAGALLLPIVLAAAGPLLPGPVSSYLSPGPESVSPALTGLARGLFLGVVALPLVMAARVVWPVGLGALLAGCLLIAASGAGAAAAAAAFRARGLAAAVVATALPGLLGFLAADVCPPLVSLARLSPFLAAPAALEGAGGWGLGLVPGIALLAAGLLAGRRSP